MSDLEIQAEVAALAQVTDTPEHYMDDLTARTLRAVASALEVEALRAVHSNLPRGLRWAATQPRTLRLLYRLRPAWRPTLTTVAPGYINVTRA